MSPEMEVAAMIFEGRIRTLSNHLTDGFLRREIIVRSDPQTGYPSHGDSWSVTSADGLSHKLTFIKGAHKGHVLVGQSNYLTTWFRRRYPKDVVVNDYVFFEKLGYARFRILSSEEWLSQHGLKGSLRWSK
jgi:hypothetical protein